MMRDVALHPAFTRSHWRPSESPSMTLHVLRISIVRILILTCFRLQTVCRDLFWLLIMPVGIGGRILLWDEAFMMQSLSDVEHDLDSYKRLKCLQSSRAGDRFSKLPIFTRQYTLWVLVRGEHIHFAHLPRFSDIDSFTIF